jgi:pyruvate,water dikinase
VHTLSLGGPGCDDPAVVGAKAANLSRLAAAYRVPPGFVIPARPATEAPSPDLWAAIVEAYHALATALGDAAPPVAVRSSAVDEDGDAASFAGQHATVLGVRGEPALRDAVREVMASAVTPAALAYRTAHALPTDGVRIAVLVQSLVPAEVSAVAFSQNVIARDPDEVVINASWGLGEPIVSGEVTPDTYLVNALEFTVLRREVADKAVLRALTPEGLATVAVPEERRRAPSLSDTQAVAIARLACDLERHMGWPVDIECAYAGEELFLLQCRPITTGA